MVRPEISVEGIDEFRKALRRMDDGLGKELGKAHKELGTRIVRWSDDRRSQLAARFPSYQAGVLKVKPSANQRRLQVTVRPAAAETGIRRHPVFGRWMDQSTFRNHVWPPPSREGWLIRPTAEQHRPQIESEYLDAVAGLARRVGLTVE